MAKQNTEIIDFVRRTTEAIVVISETTKANKEISESIRDNMQTNNTIAVQGISRVESKVDSLMTFFKFVIIPLIAGILALVGVKMVFNL